MTDLTQKLLPGLRQNRFPALNLGDDLVYPQYAGGSLLNVPSTACRFLGIPDWGAPPLQPEIMNAAGGNYDRVIVLVLDGLGLQSFQRFLQEGIGRVWQRLLANGVLAPITSICPSTTSAALTTLWTGTPPASHGIAGYELWLREYGVVANMILHSAMTFLGDTGGLRRAGFQPETFLPDPVIGGHMVQHGVQPYAFLHQSISRSGLSMMHLQDSQVNSYVSPADLWVSLASLLNQKPDERMYVYAYWGELDTLAHLYGPDDERVAAEFNAFSHIFDTCFLNRLTASGRQKTLVVLTADHGLIRTERDAQRDLRNHPDLTRALHMHPTGENRLTYFHLRPGQENFVRDYIEKNWPGQFSILPSSQVLESGLMGPTPQPYEKLADRLGDLVAVAHDGAYFWWPNKENRLIGRHGGLSEREMLIPFFAFQV